MAATSTLLAARKPAARSRVTNGRDLLPGVDGRSTVARRYRDILAALTTDQGGADRMSEARAQLCRRFAAAAVLAEAMEARLAAGETIDLGEHALLSSTLVRLAQRIGIDRRARDITPTLRDYLSKKGAEPDAA
jgi:hypothetical protein